MALVAGGAEVGGHRGPAAVGGSGSRPRPAPGRWRGRWAVRQGGRRSCGEHRVPGSGPRASRLFMIRRASGTSTWRSPAGVAQGRGAGHDRRGGRRAAGRPHGVPRRAEAGLRVLAFVNRTPPSRRAARQAAGSAPIRASLPAVARPIGWSSARTASTAGPAAARRSTRASDQQARQSQVQQEAGRPGQRPGFREGFAQDQFHA